LRCTNGYRATRRLLCPKQHWVTVETLSNACSPQQTPVETLTYPCGGFALHTAQRHQGNSWHYGSCACFSLLRRWSQAIRTCPCAHPTCRMLQLLCKTCSMEASLGSKLDPQLAVSTPQKLVAALKPALHGICNDSACAVAIDTSRSGAHGVSIGPGGCSFGCYLQPLACRLVLWPVCNLALLAAVPAGRQGIKHTVS
jgi:hypothetical protein